MTTLALPATAFESGSDMFAYSSTSLANTPAATEETRQPKMSREEFLEANAPPFAKRVRLLVGYALLLVLIVASNTAALVTLTWQRRRRRRLGSELLMHLCAACLIVGVACCGVNWMATLTIEWIGGDLLCRAAQFAQALGLYATSYLILAISVDRCLAVLDPIGSAQTVRRRLVLALSAWAFGALFSLPQVRASPYRLLRVFSPARDVQPFVEIYIYCSGGRIAQCVYRVGLRVARVGASGC